MGSHRIKSAFFVGALVVTGMSFGAAPASAQNCWVGGPGIGKTSERGVTEYYEEPRCGEMDKRHVNDPPPPILMEPNTDYCYEAAEGDYCIFFKPLGGGGDGEWMEVHRTYSGPIGGGNGKIPEVIVGPIENVR